VNLPDYLIVGECKCGTSSLYHYLTRHPQILETYGNGIDDYLGTKELRYFDRYYAKGLDWYMSRFPDTNDEQITGEASPEYYSRTMCLWRIAEALPNTKILVLLRDPVDRLYSHFHHMQKWIPGWKDKYISFESFLNSAREEDNYLIEKGIYIEPLLKWEVAFGEQMKVISSEAFFNESQVTCDVIFDWLGVGSFKLEGFEKLRSTESSPMKSETRDMLKEFYLPYNKRLFEHFGWLSGWWNNGT
jgi:hypothetical protein